MSMSENVSLVLIGIQLCSLKNNHNISRLLCVLDLDSYHKYVVHVPETFWHTCAGSVYLISVAVIGT